MSLYKLDQKTYDLTKESGLKKNSLLKPFHLNKEKFVLCLCNGGDGIPLVTALADGNYYVRAFPSKSKKGIHSRSCIHFVPNEHDFAIRGYNEEAIKLNAEGIYTFSLSTSLRKNKEQTSLITGSLPHTFKNGSSITTSNTITLLGLFNFMWEQAGLNSSEAVNADVNIWSALRKVSWRIQPKSMQNLTYGMSDFLVLPTTECTKASDYNDTKLYYAIKNKRHILFAVSLTGKEIIEHDIHNPKNESGFSLKNHFGVKIKLAKTDSVDVLSKFNRSFKHEITNTINHEDINLIIFGMASVKEYNKHKYAEIQTLSAMAVSYNCIPLDSMHEKTLTDFLIKEKRTFIKPMRYDQTSELKLLPDFILLDTSPKCLVEVYGMTTPDYLNRKAEKKRIYEEIEDSTLLNWNWDATQTNNLLEWVQHNPLPCTSQ